MNGRNSHRKKVTGNSLGKKKSQEQFSKENSKKKKKKREKKRHSLLRKHARGGSNEYPQSMFWSKIRKIGIPLHTPVLLYKSGVHLNIAYLYFLRWLCIARTCSIKNFQFLQLRRNVYITWTCYRNVWIKEIKTST